MMLTFEESLRSHVHRAWRFLDTLSKGSEGIQTDTFNLNDTESIVGVYKFENDEVIITTLGVRTRVNDSLDSIFYREIMEVSIDTESENKHRVDSIQFKTRDGSLKSIPIRGGDTKLRDAWLIYTLFKHVVSAYQRVAKTT